MSGLMIKLRPHERLLVNGVVIENGIRKAHLRIRTEGANILRLREAIAPDDAATPVKRAYYIAQRVVTGELQAEDAITQLREAVAKTDPDLPAEALEVIERFIAGHDFYQAMRRLGEMAAKAEETGVNAGRTS